MAPRLLEAAFLKALRAYHRRHYNWAAGNTGFPLTPSGENFLLEPLFGSGVHGYWTGIYNEPTNPRWYLDPFSHQLELLWGSSVAPGTAFRLEVENAAVPYMVRKSRLYGPDKGYSVELRVDGQARRLSGLVADRHYYLAFPGKAAVELSSSTGLVVGRPLPLRLSGRRRRRLVLCLFVDGLTYELFLRHPLAEAAPNVHRFFSRGTVFSQCHVTSEWSLPGLASLHTGLRVARHKMSDPNAAVRFGDYPVMAELFQKAGYMTFQACGNWRKSPSYGYARGFDRTIYKRQLSLKDVNYAFFDQLRAFPERDVFAWLSYFDLHHVINATPDVGEQVRYSIAAHDYLSSKKKSTVQVEVDRPRAERYLRELAKVDFHMGLLFDFVESRYSDEELLVALVADHGTGFITPGSHQLKRERTHVPWLLRGGGAPAGISEELVQNVDVLPSLLTLSGIPVPPGLDGRLPALLGGPAARDHVVCESVYPGAPYLATIKDREYDFYREDGKTELYRADDPATEISSREPRALERFARLFEAVSR